MKWIGLCLGTAALALSACQKKAKIGFGLADSPIRYEKTAFSDTKLLAEADGVPVFKSDILDHSLELKELDERENEALIGLAYLKVIEKTGQQKLQGEVTIFLPRPKHGLVSILNPFERSPYIGLGVAYKAPTGQDQETIARYKDILVKRGELDLNHDVLRSLRQRRYEEIAHQLNRRLTRLLIARQARKEGKDFEHFLKVRVYGGAEPSVDNVELQSYLLQIGMTPRALTKKLRPHFVHALKLKKEGLLMETYVAKNLLNSPVKVAFDEPDTQPKILERWKPMMGYLDAPVSLVAFGSVDCADCAQLVRTLKAAMERYDGHLRLNWIYNVDPENRFERHMAETALCVKSLKRRRTIDFLEAFSEKKAATDEEIYQWADDNDINSKALQNCLSQEKKADTLAEHLAYAKHVGVITNPTLRIEGRTIQGVISSERLDQMIQQSLRAKHSTWSQAYFRRVKAFFSSI